MSEPRRWELAPRFSHRTGLAAGALAAAVWAPVEAGLAWLTAATVGTPFGASLGVDGLPADWAAVPAGTGLLAATAGVTAVGAAWARHAAAGGRTDVVTADERGIRTERRGLKGARNVVDVEWDRIYAADFQDGAQRVFLRTGFDGTGVSLGGTPDQHREIQAHVHARITRGDDPPPRVPGWSAWYDDHGATLQENRRDRRVRAALWGGASVAAGVNTAACYVATGSDYRWWFLAIPGGVATLGWLGYCAEELAPPPRWIARPGKVVLEERGPGRGYAFEALSLEHVTLEYEAGGTGSRLVAHRAADATGGSHEVLTNNHEAPARVGPWLARHADVPIHWRTEWVPIP